MVAEFKDEGKKKNMKVMKEILLSAVLMIIVCLAGTRTVRADVLASLERLDDEYNYKYTVTGLEPESSYTISIDNCGYTETKQSDNSGNVSFSFTADDIWDIYKECESVQPKDVNVSLKDVSGTSKTDTVNVKICSVKLGAGLTASLDKVPYLYAGQPMPIEDGIEITAEAPYYIDEVIDEVDNTLVEEISYTYGDGGFPIPDSGEINITSAKVKAEITVVDTTEAVPDVEIEWDPAQLYPYAEVNATGTTKNAFAYPKYDPGLALYLLGKGSTTLQAKVGNELDGSDAEAVETKTNGQSKLNFDVSFTVEVSGDSSLDTSETGDYDLTILDKDKSNVTSDFIALRDFSGLINWAVDKTSVATIAKAETDPSQAVLTPKSGGEVNVTAAVLGKNSNKFEVSIDEVVTDIKISGDQQIMAGDTNGHTYKAEVIGAKNQNVTWSVGATDPATINSKTGVLKLSSSATAGDPITVTATAYEGTSKNYEVEVVDCVTLDYLIYLTAQDDLIKITKSVKDSNEYKLDLSWGKGVSGEPKNASVKEIEYEVEDTSILYMSSKMVFIPKKTGITTIAPVTIKYKKTGYDEPGTPTIDVEVVDDWMAKSIESSSSSSTSGSSAVYRLKLTNDEVYTSGDSLTENIKDIAGYRIDVIYGGNVIGGKTFTHSSMDGSGYQDITRDELNEVLKDVSGNLSGDSPSVKFRISPYGKTLKEGTNGYVTKAARETDSRTVYKSGNTYYIDKDSSSSSSSMKSSSGQGSGSGSDYDKVPKTGEGNTRLLIIMIAVISATIAGSILLSNLPVRSKSGADESVDDKDVLHKKD